jgi:hypothetical protein
VENGKSELPVRFSIYLMHPIDLDPYWFLFLISVNYH